MEIISLEEHLKELAKKSKANQELLACWQIAKIEYTKLLDSVKLSYPFYSRHDGSHSQSVIQNVERLLGKEGISKLGVTDTWLLLECSFIHDFGMILDSKIVKKEWDSPEFKIYRKDLLRQKKGDLYDAAVCIAQVENIEGDKKEAWPIKIYSAVRLLVSDYYRVRHADRTESDYLKKWVSGQQSKMIKKRLVNLVAKIASLHTAKYEKVLELQQVTNGQANDYAHPRFIATLLRLGDILDLDNNRFDTYTQIILKKEIPNDTKLHHDKHESITHFTVTPKLVEIHADCPNVEVYFETRRWIEFLEDEIKNSTINWIEIAPHKYPVLPKVLSRLHIAGKKIFNGFEKVKYDISQEKMFDIIKGADIYETEYVFVREFIQNALDATKLKIWEDLKNGRFKGLVKEPKEIQPWDFKKTILEKYKIMISVEAEEIDSDTTKIFFSISDNGIGITTDDVKRIARIGNSWRKDNVRRIMIEEMPPWLRPTGAFGIGMQSAFLLTNEIVIHTINEKKQGMELRLRNNIKGNEQILVMEAMVPEDYKTKISVQFEVPNDTLIKGRPIIFNEDLQNINVFVGKVFKKLWEARIIRDAQQNTQYSFIPVTYKATDETQDDIIYKRPYNNHQINLPTEIQHNISYNQAIARCVEKGYASYNDLREVIIWDDGEGIYLQYHFFNSRHNVMNGSRSKLYFKEIEVTPTPYMSDSPRSFSNMFHFEGNVFNLIISLWGWDTADCLMLNRNSIKLKYHEVIKNFINEKTKQFMPLLQQELLRNVPPECNAFSFYFMFLKYAPHLITVELKDKLANNAEGNLKVLRLKEDQKYEIDSKSISEVIQEYPQLYFADLGLDSYIRQNENNVLSKLNGRCKIPWIIYEQPFVNWFHTISKTESFKYENNVRFYTYEDSRPTGDVILHKIHWKYPIIKEEEYPELHVSKLPLPYSVEKIGENYVPPYIIQPFRNYELIDQKKHIKIDEYLDQIIQSNEFISLLNYVYQNQANQGRYSISQIKTGYIRFINNYWNRTK